MPYLLDTDTLSFILNGNPTVAAKKESLNMSELAYSSVITEGELLAGALRMGRGRRLELLGEIKLLLEDVAGLLPVTSDIAHAYGRLRRDLEAEGKMMGVNDLWIAATAMQAEFTLVSHDSDFQRLTGLQVEDWLA